MERKHFISLIIAALFLLLQGLSVSHAMDNGHDHHHDHEERSCPIAVIALAENHDVDGSGFELELDHDPVLPDHPGRIDTQVCSTGLAADRLANCFPLTFYWTARAPPA